MRYEADKPCVEESVSTFDDLMKWAKLIDRYYPTCYAPNAKKSQKTCGVIYYEYVHVNLPGAFRPRMMHLDSGNCYPSEELTKPVCESIKVPAGGETENIYIAMQDVQRLT